MPASPSSSRWLVVAALVAAAVARGQDAPADTAAAAADTSGGAISVSLIPPELETFGIVWVPRGLYSSARGLGLGAEGALPFRVLGDRTSRLSELRAGAVLTTKKQVRVESALDLYSDRDRNYARIRFDHSTLATAFYGVGPNSQRHDAEYFEPSDWLAYAEYRRRLFRILRVGLRVEYENHELHGVDSGGLLATGDYRGTRAGDVFGGGFTWDFDTRDRRYDPRHGWYAQGFVMAFSEKIVGDHDFDVVYAEVRQYRAWSRSFTLAKQLFYYSARGGAPFWRLASIGGRAHSRGYQRNRWLDETLVAGQLEGRWRVGGRFGLVAFAGAAAVNHDLRSMTWDTVRPTFGAGVRYFVPTGGEELPIRLDAAVGWQSLRVSFGLGDAF